MGFIFEGDDRLKRAKQSNITLQNVVDLLERHYTIVMDDWAAEDYNIDIFDRTRYFLLNRIGSPIGHIYVNTGYTCFWKGYSSKVKPGTYSPQQIFDMFGGADGK